MDQLRIKKNTNPDLTGTSETGSPNKQYVEMPYTEVHSVSPGEVSFKDTDDSTKVLTGPGAHSSSGASINPTINEKFEWTTSTGSRVSVDDDTVSLIHHSGAGVQVDPDGSIYVTGTGRRGTGISAPKGDAFIKAGALVVIDAGGSLSIRARGDLNIDVGGNLNLSVEGMIITRSSGVDETVDGSKSSTIVNDNSVIIGGMNRETIAGDSRTQISGNHSNDVAGNSDSRVDGNISTSSQGNMTQTTSGNMSSFSGGNQSISASGTMKLASSGSLSVGSGSSASISSQGGMNIASASGMKVGGSSTQISGGSVTASTTVTTGSVTNDPTNVEIDQPEISKAQILEANTIIDSITSKRLLPNYPTNAMYETSSYSSYSLPEYEGDTESEKAYNQYTSGNSGTNDSPNRGGDYGEYPESSMNNNSESVESPYSTTSVYNSDAKISRHFTLGELTNAKHSHRIPASKRSEIIQAHIHTAYNVLDPIRDKFDIIVTSAYRGNSKNHITGYAIDIVTPSRSLEVHAEIARFARDNLPCSQVFLERNTSGRTHVHVRCHPPGESGSPKVLTCGDSKCRTRTSGIVVEYLQNKGVR